MKTKGHKSRGNHCNWYRTKSFIEERPEFETNCGEVYKMEPQERRRNLRISECPYCNRVIQVMGR